MAMPSSEVRSPGKNMAPLILYGIFLKNGIRPVLQKVPDYSPRDVQVCQLKDQHEHIMFIFMMYTYHNITTKEKMYYTTKQTNSLKLEHAHAD